MAKEDVQREVYRLTAENELATLGANRNRVYELAKKK